MLDEVGPAALPANALLHRYQEGSAFVDCYAVRVGGLISHARFVAAFYSTWLFKVERFILRVAASRPSTDEEALELGTGMRDRFAAWQVERRTDDQILLCDFTGRTRSWLMTVAGTQGEAATTLLYFGSAVVPRINPRTRQPGLGAGFNLLLGFHKLYSRLLLRAACARLRRTA